MSNQYFYENLPTFNNLSDISTEKYYEKLPEDWCIVATDIRNSTQAIEEGKYKEVNMIGALSIVTILNLNKSLDIPFIFGGDGAFLLIPKMLLHDVKQALLATQKIALEAYNLELRIGIIPVHDLYEQKQILLITKLQVSDDYSQAIIKGGGLEYCDALLKQDSTYHILDKIDSAFIVNTDGLECRWENVPSPKDEILSILIKAYDDNYYSTILHNIDKILGNQQQRHPIMQDKLKLSYDDKVLNKEVSLSENRIQLKKIKILKLKWINLIGDLLITFKIGKWSKYKKQVITTTDTEKFDDMLRMVVSSDFDQTKKLEVYLQNELKNKKLVYGIHKADSSLMTCLIFERHGKQIHFVDASNGGYAMASKMLKNFII